MKDKFLFSRHPDDVDLFVGVNHENHLPDALVGPVSACIIGTQFQHLKYGDRFFYSHQGEFTPGIKTLYYQIYLTSVFLRTIKFN